MICTGSYLAKGKTLSLLLAAGYGYFVLHAYRVLRHLPNLVHHPDGEKTILNFPVPNGYGSGTHQLPMYTSLSLLPYSHISKNPHSNFSPTVPILTDRPLLILVDELY